MKLAVRVIVGFGIFCFVFGAGLYYLWDFFILGGIRDITGGFKAEPTDSGRIAVGAILILLSKGALVLWVLVSYFITSFVLAFLPEAPMPKANAKSH